MMKFKLLFLVGLLSLVLVVSSCGKGIGAGQAVAGFSDTGCVSGQWCYEVGGKMVGCDTGCTTMNDKGVMNKEDPWCAISTVNKNGKQVYVGGSGKWKPCAKEQSGPVSCAGGTMCGGTPVTGKLGQVVCGTDFQNWKCTSGGWVGQKDSCVCPTTTKPVTGYGGNPPCTDSDGQNFFTKGKVISATYPQGKEDYCSEDKVYLFEGICLNDEYTYINKKCSESYGAGATCAEGKCVVPPATPITPPPAAPSGTGLCSESDSGKEYLTKGTLTTPKGEQFTDFCSKGAASSSASGIKVDSSDYVYEYYCFDDKTQSGGTEIVKCDGGCKDGKGSGVCGEPKACTKIVFADANLETAIKKQLNILANKDVTTCDAKSVKSLYLLNQKNLNQKKIIQLSGLEYFTNLQNLHLGSNQISDISALKGLTKLQSLDLISNQIIDIGALSGLTNLQDLDLYSNQISDLSSLKGLTSLTDLNLNSNQISDVSVLKGLTNLQYLSLDNNKISDTSYTPDVCSFINVLKSKGTSIGGFDLSKCPS